MHLRADFPLLQVQPLPREAYSETTLNATAVVPDMSGMGDEDWSAYHATIVSRHKNPDRPFGAYAVAARKRRQSECPFGGERRRSPLNCTVRPSIGLKMIWIARYPGQAQALGVPVPILGRSSGDRARANAD